MISHVTGLKAYVTELARKQQPSLELSNDTAKEGAGPTNIIGDQHLNDDDSPLGHFRGEVVIRKAHRPPEMTLDEMMASTDASGYWTQTWDGESEPYSSYHVAIGKIPRGGDLLRRLDDPTAEYCLGNAYATDWETVSFPWKHDFASWRSARIR